MSSKGASLLFQHLEKSSFIAEVDLSGNKIDDNCMEDLGKMLSKNKVLNTILLGSHRGGNNISDNGIKLLHKSFKSNISLVQLGLLQNPKITEKSEKFLRDILERSKLRRIDIDGLSVVSQRIVLDTVFEQIHLSRDDMMLSDQ